MLFMFTINPYVHLYRMGFEWRISLLLVGLAFANHWASKHRVNVFTHIIICVFDILLNFQAKWFPQWRASQPHRAELMPTIRPVLLIQIFVFINGKKIYGGILMYTCISICICICMYVCMYNTYWCTCIWKESVIQLGLLNYIAHFHFHFHTL